MRYLFNLIVLLLLSIQYSCDPLQNIQFLNESSSLLKVEIQSKQKNNIQTEEDLHTTNNRTLEIPSHEKRTILFTIGTWDKEQIQSYAQSLDYIMFENKDKKIVYKSEEEIYNLLRNNHSSLFSSHTIKIKFK
ncbi:MAG: hypothetical protein ACR2MS_09505 [Weeksellaceae bacterium]